MRPRFGPKQSTPRTAAGPSASRHRGQKPPNAAIDSSAAQGPHASATYASSSSVVRSSSRSAASSAATIASVSSGSSRTPSGCPPDFGTEPSAANHHDRSAAGSTCTVPRGPNVLTSDRSSQSAAATSARVVSATRSARETSTADITWACAPAIAAAASGNDAERRRPARAGPADGR